jgi:hypothetical protein
MTKEGVGRTGGKKIYKKKKKTDGGPDGGADGH